MNSINKKICTPINIICLILYIVSFCFAQEDKKELLYVLFITVSILMLTFYITKDEHNNIDKYNSKTEAYIFTGYLIIYYIFILFNGIYNIVQTDYVNFILLFIIPYIISRAFGYRLNELGFTVKNSSKVFYIIIGSLILITIAMYKTTFKEYIVQNDVTVFTGICVYLMAFFMTLVLAGIPEEFFFRVVLQSRIEKKVNNSSKSIVLSAIIFAIYHIPYRLFQVDSVTFNSLTYTIFSVISQQFLMGLFLGYIWNKTRNIYGLILVHSCYNAYLLMSIINI